MYIPLIEKDPDANDFTCRDGEIEFMARIKSEVSDEGSSNGGDTGAIDAAANAAFSIRHTLTPEGDYPTANIRIPLEKGDADKVALMLQGQSARVDAATADRLRKEITVRAAEEFSGIVLEKRKLGLHFLPFRIWSMTVRPDGMPAFPSAQAVMLPSENPPHPEIVAHSIADDTLTLSLRFTVRPHRLGVTASGLLPEGYTLQTFVSYPLYIPKSDEITGSLGSVRSTQGGNAMGIRFSFLSTGNLKYSVAAPDKYYRLTGNAATGYRLASKAADAPDYTLYATHFGYVPPFPVPSLVQEGCEADPFEWIADWESAGEGALPLSLPYIYRCRQDGSGDGDTADKEVATGVGMEYIRQLVEETGLEYVLLTRPMTLADAEKSRRKAQAQPVMRMQILGLPDSQCLAVLLGSHDGSHYEAMRRFDPHRTSFLFSPPRLFHRLLLLCSSPFPSLALQAY